MLHQGLPPSPEGRQPGPQSSVCVYLFQARVPFVLGGALVIRWAQGGGDMDVTDNCDNFKNDLLASAVSHSCLGHFPGHSPQWLTSSLGQDLKHTALIQGSSKLCLCFVPHPSRAPVTLNLLPALLKEPQGCPSSPPTCCPISQRNSPPSVP